MDGGARREESSVLSGYGLVERSCWHNVCFSLSFFLSFLIIFFSLLSCFVSFCISVFLFSNMIHMLWLWLVDIPS